MPTRCRSARRQGRQGHRGARNLTQCVEPPTMQKRTASPRTQSVWMPEKHSGRKSDALERQWRTPAVPPGIPPTARRPNEFLWSSTFFREAWCPREGGPPDRHFSTLDYIASAMVALSIRSARPISLRATSPARRLFDVSPELLLHATPARPPASRTFHPATTAGQTRVQAP